MKGVGGEDVKNHSHVKGKRKNKRWRKGGENKKQFYSLPLTLETVLFQILHLELHLGVLELSVGLGELAL